MADINEKFPQLGKTNKEDKDKDPAEISGKSTQIFEKEVEFKMSVADWLNKLSLDTSWDWNEGVELDGYFMTGGQFVETTEMTVSQVRENLTRYFSDYFRSKGMRTQPRVAASAAYAMVKKIIESEPG